MTAPPSTARSRGTWIAAALLAVVVFLTFSRVLAADFVRLDDERFVVRNPNVQTTESWLRLFTDPRTADPAAPPTLVRPLRTAEFALDRAVFDGKAWGFHLHSVLWHVAAAVLLLTVLRRLGLGAAASFAAALVWAVHPAQVESVAWVSSRGDVASGACCLAAVLFALRSQGFDRDLAVSLAFAAAAMLYKESAFALPLVLLVLRWTKLSRSPVWPQFALLASCLVYRAVVQRGLEGHGVTFALGGGGEGTIATMARAFGFYVAETFLPAQSLDWYLPTSTSLTSRGVVPWMAVHAAIVVSAIVLRRRAPLWTVAVAWICAFLAPVSNVVVFLGIPTAERFLYLPLAGFAIALGWGLDRSTRAALAPVLVAAGALAVTSFGRTAMWYDTDTLWRTVLADHESPRALANAGERLRLDALAVRDRSALLPEGPERAAAEVRRVALLEEALDDFHRGLDLWYGFELSDESLGQFAAGAETNAANVCWLLGRDTEALFHAEAALRIDETAAAAHYDRALALLELGFAPQADESMRRAEELGLAPPEWELAEFRARAARMSAESTRSRSELDAELARLPRSCPLRGRTTR